MKISKNEVDALNASIHITIEPSDYVNKFEEEVTKYKNKAQIKGFRKGKTPVSAVKKMYGKSLLVDLINNMLSESLNTFIKEENLDLLGQPIPSDEQGELNFNIKELGAYNFIFDVGIAPSFEVQGLDSKIERLVIDLPEAMITEELDLARKKLGTENFIEDDIEENDMVTLSAVELEGDNVKKDGWVTGFPLLVSLVEDEVKAVLLTKKKGDKFRFNIRTVEKDKNEKYINKYLLNLDENEEKEIGDFFEGTIEKVSRITPAPLEQEFFEKYLGEEGVETSEEEIRAKIRENISKHYVEQTKNMLFRDIMDRLMEANEIELPSAFLKRWLKISNEQATDEVIEAEFEAFSKNLSWNLIKDKLDQQFEIKVEPEDIKEGFKKRIASYFGGNPQGIDLDQMAESMMKNQEQFRQVYDEEKAEKLFQAISEKINIQEKVISLDEFRELVKKINARTPEMA